MAKQETKKCKTCGKNRLLKFYKANPNLKLGYELHCDDCRLEKRRKDYVENHERYLAYAKKYRSYQWAKERIANYNKEYYKRPEIRERNNAWHREYRKRLGEKHKQYMREYYQKNKEKLIKAVKKCQAKKKKA